MKERKSSVQIAVMTRGQMFAVRSSEHTIPAAAAAVSAPSSHRTQKMLGAYQYRVTDLLEIAADGKNAALADQPNRLPRQRIEGGEEDQPERAQEDPSRREDICRARREQAKE